MGRVLEMTSGGGGMESCLWRQAKDLNLIRALHSSIGLATIGPPDDPIDTGSTRSTSLITTNGKSIPSVCFLAKARKPCLPNAPLLMCHITHAPRRKSNALEACPVGPNLYLASTENCNPGTASSCWETVAGAIALKIAIFIGSISLATENEIPSNSGFQERSKEVVHKQHETLCSPHEFGAVFLQPGLSISGYNFLRLANLISCRNTGSGCDRRQGYRNLNDGTPILDADLSYPLPTPINTTTDAFERKGMAPAAAALAEVEKLINDEAQALNPDQKKRKNRVRHILNNVNKAMGVLERVADVHPATQRTVPVTDSDPQGLLKLEMDRRENSEHIVVLYHPMARMLAVLSHLEQMVLDGDDPVTQQLADVLGQVTSPSRLAHLLTGFDADLPVVFTTTSVNSPSHRKEIQEILVIKNELRGKMMTDEIEQLRINTEKIIARLGEPSSDQEIKALEIIRQYGKDYVLHDKVKLEEVSALVGGGKVSGHTQALLDTSIDSLLASNMDQFHRKLESSMSQITDSINKSRDAILKKASLLLLQ
ncbi:169_t:CDS:10, partial [Acaulospora colombiana]